LYSVANIANGFANSIESYSIWRFVAGFGLAGELGAGITLVAEIMSKEKRGYATTIVASVGVSGAVVAYFIAQYFTWQTSYFIGGGLGLVLLVLRISVYESGMYEKLKKRNISRGNIALLFGTRERTLKYVNSILIGLPIWFVVGILVTFSPEFGKALGLSAPIEAGKAVMLAFTGQVFGDLVSGFLSQYMQSRKKVIILFVLSSLVLVLVYLLAPVDNTFMFYAVITLLGFCNGYWTLFVTVAAELFGTNLRATVATTVPNFVRGAVIPLTALFTFGRPYLGTVYSALATGLVAFTIALLALRHLEETFTKELDYTEE